MARMWLPGDGIKTENYRNFAGNYRTDAGPWKQLRCY